jgi:hypothetical protein
LVDKLGDILVGLPSGEVLAGRVIFPFDQYVMRAETVKQMRHMGDEAA